MPFFVRAAVEALRAFDRKFVGGRNEYRAAQECNIGVAVALDWGLIVPVIKNAEEKTFSAWPAAMNEFGRTRAHEEAQTRGSCRGNVAITNPGVFGGCWLASDQSAERRNPRIGHHREASGGIDDAIAIRSMAISRCRTIIAWWMAAVAHQFMGKIKHTLENWTEEILYSNHCFTALDHETKACGLVAGFVPTSATSYLLSSMCATPKLHNWGSPPWQIDFTATSKPAPLPNVLDFAVIGGGFTD